MVMASTGRDSGALYLAVSAVWFLVFTTDSVGAILAARKLSAAMFTPPMTLCVLGCNFITDMVLWNGSAYVQQWIALIFTNCIICSGVYLLADFDAFDYAANQLGQTAKIESYLLVQKQRGKVLASMLRDISKRGARKAPAEAPAAAATKLEAKAIEVQPASPAKAEPPAPAEPPALAEAPEPAEPPASAEAPAIEVTIKT